MKTDLIKGKAKSQFGEYFRRRSAKQLRFRLNEDGLGTTSFIQHILAVALGAHTDVQRFSTASRAQKEIPATTQEYECEHISTISSLASRPLAWCSQAQPWQPPAMCNDSSCWQIGWELTVRQILQQHEPSGINGPLVLFAKVFISNLPLKTWKLTIARHDSFPILAIHTFQSPKKPQTIKLLDTSVVFFCKIPLISHLFGFNFIEAILHFDTSVWHPFRLSSGLPQMFSVHLKSWPRF